MPQLNPYPWFMVLIYTWVIFTMIIMPKVADYKFINEPKPQSLKTFKMVPWNWKWN